MWFSVVCGPEEASQMANGENALGVSFVLWPSNQFQKQKFPHIKYSLDPLVRNWGIHTCSLALSALRIPVMWLKGHAGQELFVPGYWITNVALKATPTGLSEEQLRQKMGEPFNWKETQVHDMVFNWCWLKLNIAKWAFKGGACNCGQMTSSAVFDFQCVGSLSRPLDKIVISICEKSCLCCGTYMKNDILEIITIVLAIILVRTCSSLVGNFHLSKPKQKVKGASKSKQS